MHLVHIKTVKITYILFSSKDFLTSPPKVLYGHETISKILQNGIVCFIYGLCFVFLYHLFLFGIPFVSLEGPKEKVHIFIENS